MEIALNPIRQRASDHVTLTNPLPQLLHTPCGLALVEMQGTINLPDYEEGDLHGETPVGRLVFPLYDEAQEGGGKGWMKAVWLYVGRHQRMTGEVKKLPKALAVVRKRVPEDGVEAMDVDGEKRGEELEIVQIVKYKILFSLRPEPVGALVEGEESGFGRGFMEGCFWNHSQEMRIDGCGYAFLSRCGKHKLLRRWEHLQHCGTHQLWSL